MSAKPNHSATALGMTNTANTFNAFGEAAGIAVLTGGSDLFREVYNRDALGRITDRTESTPLGAASFHYDYVAITTDVPRANVAAGRAFLELNDVNRRLAAYGLTTCAE
jgi:hypothetical protein